MIQEVLDRINKIKELAERGVGGEKVNAENLLAKLLKKYNISEDDLVDDKVSEHEFQYWGEFGKELFNQVVFSILGENANVLRYVHKRNCKTRFVPCTEAQAIEIKETFEFYRNHLDVGLRSYFDAFVQVERIFPTDSKPRKMTMEEELAWINSDAHKLCRSMSKHERLLMIEDGDD